MFQRNSLNRKKKRKKFTFFCYTAFKLLIILSIPFLYKIYFCSYLKTRLKFIYTINSLDKYIPYLKDAYFILFNKYYLQLAIPLLLIYNYCNIYKTFILLISLQIPLIVSQILNIYLIKNIKDTNEINDELLNTTGYSLILWEILFNSDYDEKIQYSFRSIDSIKKSSIKNKFF